MTVDMPLNNNLCHFIFFVPSSQVICPILFSSLMPLLSSPLASLPSSLLFPLVSPFFLSIVVSFFLFSLLMPLLSSPLSSSLPSRLPFSLFSPFFSCLLDFFSPDISLFLLSLSSSLLSSLCCISSLLPLLYLFSPLPFHLLLVDSHKPSLWDICNQKNGHTYKHCTNLYLMCTYANLHGHIHAHWRHS